MTDIALNVQFHAHRPTDMQRYALEFACCFADRIQLVRRAKPVRGATGHLWEHRLFWSPNNTGLLAIARQRVRL